MTQTTGHSSRCIEVNLGRVQGEVEGQGLQIAWGETDAENYVPAWGRTFESLREQWMAEGNLRCDGDPGECEDTTADLEDEASASADPEFFCERCDDPAPHVHPYCDHCDSTDRHYHSAHTVLPS